MYHNSTKRFLCVLLTLALLLGNVALAASAAQTTTAATVNASEVVEVVLETTDDLAGAYYADVSFYCVDGEENYHYLNVWLESEYYDDETNKYVPYPDGELHGLLELGEYVYSGTYRIGELSVYDRADNFNYYIRDYNPEDHGDYASELPAALKEVTLTVKNPNPLDETPPQLKSIKLSGNSLTVPEGTIEVIVTATDDLSGLSNCSIEFWCQETDSWMNCYLQSTYWDYETGREVAYPNGELHGTLEAYEDTAAGTYYINYVNLRDKAGNDVVYFNSVYEETDTRKNMTDEMKAISVTVINDYVADKTIPQLNTITLSGTKLTNDGKLEVIVDATDAGNNLNDGYIYFVCEETGKEIYCRVRSTYYSYESYQYVPYADGKLHGTVYGLEYAPSGTFRLDRMRLYDDSNNYHHYYMGGYPEYYDQNIYSDFPEALKSLQFTYTNNGPVDTAAPQVTKLYFLAEGKQEEAASVTRLAGNTRYDTAFKSADQLKSVLGVSKFENIIVASGTGFADALAGSYLASVKKAPILLVRDNKATVNQVKDYIKKNLVSGGTVYLLGGKSAVPASMETGLEGFKVKRLGGNTRYDTNLLILKEAGVAGKDILVCTGNNFADSLSASAVGLPILLVKDGLNTAQKEFLKGTTGKKYIIGGTSAVTATVEKQLASYGTVKRIAGNTRYQTSVLVAEEFFNKPTQAVLAYAQNFPDGLCGGPLAYALKAPLILTNSGKESVAAAYTKGLGIKSGYVLGGPTLISDKAVKSIFSNTPITAK